MEDTTARLLLTEFRAFRDYEFRDFKDTVAEWKQDTGERVAQLETSVKSGVTGNGQPSRLSVVEQELEQLTRFRYWLLGASAAAGSVCGAISGYILSGGKHP